MSNVRDTYRWKQARRQVLRTATHCAICDLELDPSAPPKSRCSSSVDHIEPLSRGGAPYDAANLAVTHLGCNSRKGAGRRPKRRAVDYWSKDVRSRDYWSRSGMVPATAGASNGIGAGCVAACAAREGLPQQKFGSVNFVAVPGMPGPRGGPNSTLWLPPYTNNGSDLIGSCQSP